MQSMKFSAVQRQSQTLSPRLQHAVRLLQMSTLDFRRELQEVLSKNPFLEAEDDAGAGAPLVDAVQASGADPADHAVPTLSLVDAPGALGEGNAEGENPLSKPEVGEDERDPWLADPSSASQRSDGHELTPPTDTTPAAISLTAHLHSQVNLLHLSERDRMLVKVLVESLDDDGYLRTPLEELLPLFEAEMGVTEDELQVALRWLQSCEPAGVAARSVQECLLLQLSAGAEVATNGEDEALQSSHALAVQIVTHHLDALADKDVARLAERLGCGVPAVQAACDLIRRLDPHPGWRFMSSGAHYIVPDLTVRRVRGEWTAELNSAIVPRLRLNRVYAELFQRHRRAQDGEMAAHLQEARWTLRNVEQRFATILDVAQTIVRRQSRFFDHGVLAMKPLGLKEVARETGLHESTVSRVTNNKYIATPMGVFELKYFFSRTMTTASGGACSATAIRGLMKEMIEAEAPSKPLSDAEIARRLARQGLVVARRTITKYRQHMRIEAVERRRQLA